MSHLSELAPEVLDAPHADWSIRIDQLETQLRVGIYEHEKELQPILVSLTASGQAVSCPDHIGQCFDYEPICQWIQKEWPHSQHTSLLETRVNQLLTFLFAADARISKVWIGLYKPQAITGAKLVGIERSATRSARKVSGRPGCPA